VPIVTGRGRRMGYEMTACSVSPNRWQKSTGKRQQSDVSSTVRRASAWAKTQQAARGSVLDEVLGKESA
jgi:hypothetical protein